MSCVSCVSCIELPALHCVAQGALSCVSCVCVAFKQARIHKSGRPLFEIFTRPTPQGHNMINATPTTYATRQSQQAILAQLFSLTSLFSHFQRIYYQTPWDPCYISFRRELKTSKQMTNFGRSTLFLAMLVALHSTPVSKSVSGQSFELQPSSVAWSLRACFLHEVFGHCSEWISANFGFHWFIWI